VVILSGTPVKILGSIFLLIGILVGIQGCTQTDSDSFLALQEHIARGQVELANQAVYVNRALLYTDKAAFVMIRDKELAATVRREIESGQISATNATLAVANAQVADAEEKLRRATADREDSMKWHYVPATCFAVLGLILLVIPRATPMR